MILLTKNEKNQENLKKKCEKEEHCCEIDGDDCEEGYKCMSNDSPLALRKCFKKSDKVMSGISIYYDPNGCNQFGFDKDNKSCW